MRNEDRGNGVVEEGRCSWGATGVEPWLLPDKALDERCARGTELVGVDDGKPVGHLARAQDGVALGAAERAPVAPEPEVVRDTVQRAQRAGDHTCIYLAL